MSEVAQVVTIVVWAVALVVWTWYFIYAVFVSEGRDPLFDPAHTVADKNEEMGERRPYGYWERDGCHNCEFVFKRREYDEGPELYCTVNTPERPPCCSVAMGEIDLNQPSWSTLRDAWDEWKDGRRVRREGICDMWKEASDG